MSRRAAWQRVVGRRVAGLEVETQAMGFRSIAAMAPAELAEFCYGRLRRHLRWAATVIPWWRMRVRPDDPLSRYPPLTREHLQDGFEDLRDPGRPRESFVVRSSGGSTGAAVRVWQDCEQELSSFASEVVLMGSWGLEPWDRRAELDLADSGADEAALARFADRVDAGRPPLVSGHVHALDRLAEHLLRAGRKIAPPRVVRSSGATLGLEARARIERALRAPVRDVYASQETGPLAAQCAEGGFHVLVHGSVLEIVDEHGAPCGPGRPGRVLVTDLTNRAMGLVRYEIGDVASWSTDPWACPCGSAYPCLDRVHGRTSDFLTASSGSHVHGEWFTNLFEGRPGIDRFQVHQRSRTRVEVRTVGAAGPEQMEPLIAKMRGALGPGVVVHWERVDEIPPTGSGRPRATISDVPYLDGPASAAASPPPS